MQKIPFYIILILSLVACQNAQKNQTENINVSYLRCNLLSNPLGIDDTSPLLSWEIISEQRNIKQTACQILVASSLEKLDQNIGDIWDSGQKKSDKSVHVKYKGDALKSNAQYFWKVKVWSEKGESEWSKPAKWSMGYLHFKDWNGRWIGLDKSFAWEDESKFSRLSARYFRKEIPINDKAIKRATIHIIGLGLYELHLNGIKVGDQVLSPTPTDYTKNVKYNTHDVTNMLQKGENALGVILGNGRFYTMRQNYKPYKIKTFGYPKLLLNLIVEYTDGSKDVIRTDNTWKVTANGPILTNNEYDGEEYDARKEMPGWDQSGFNDEKWLNAEYVQEPIGDIEAQMNENMKVMDVVPPISITKRKDGKYILDMGQNIAGWLKIKVKGRRGTKVTLKFAESLQENGEIFTTSLRDAKATDIYTLKGDGIEIWEPRFVYHGFRYVEMDGYPGIPSINDFEGCVVYDEMKTSATFKTSDSIINKVFQNAFWTINATYKGMPIDCPQRNERMPWLGDRAIGCYGESFVMDNSKLYIKWLDDIKNSQKPDGCISDVAPAYFRYYSDNMTWPGTYILVAEMLYNQYGLEQPIKKHYPFMKKWLNYMQDRYLKDYILTKDSYGDWCAPPKTIEEGRGKSADVKHPSQLISTAYLYHYLNIMQDFAKIADHKKDINKYKAIADSVKASFNAKFYNVEGAYYGEKTLTENILATYFDLVTDENKEAVLKTISNIILKENNGHLSSGLVGVQWLMRTLEENGLGDTAFKLATNKTYPSWGYQVENGATTIWELWNANTASPKMNSQNHVMLLGDLIIWYYESLAGIKSDRKDPGYKKIIMKPSFTSGLDYVNASYHSVHGMIKSNWRKENSKIYWNVSIPANTSALIHFPTNNIEKIEGVSSGIFNNIENERVVIDLGSGNYEFVVNIQ